MTEIFSNKKRKANIEQCKNSIGKIADNMTSVLLKKALRERGYRENDHNDMFFIYPVKDDEPIVQHELFNPLLPVVPFPDSRVDQLLGTIARREHGLALYLFTRNKKWARQVMSTQQYGGGCINEVCLHMMVKGVPFNGTGYSGMGAYHGKWGFQEFTHPSTVLTGSNRFNLSLREHPYSGKGSGMKDRFLKLFER